MNRFECACEADKPRRQHCQNCQNGGFVGFGSALTGTAGASAVRAKQPNRPPAGMKQDAALGRVP